MSELKVNKISPKTNCGTTTLGDSGDTFTIPAGVSITNNGTASGFGATGSASWNTTVKTSGFTAVAGEGYFVDTSSGAISVNLPAGTAGAVVAFKDYLNSFDTHALTLVQNGSDKIGGSTNNAEINTEGVAVTLIFIDSTRGWLITDDGNQSSVDTNPFLVATGGTESTCGNCKIHKFTGPGTFQVTKTAFSASNNQLSYLVVAGGGSGGYDVGGGGGAGGFREVKNPVTPYTASPLDGYATPGNIITATETSYPITVGAGAARPDRTSGGSNPMGVSGNNSTFSSITSTAGGGGGGWNPGGNAGLAGGSGGGGAGWGPGTSPGGAGNTPPTTPSQGNNGGTNPSPGTGWIGASGGGATAVGAAGFPGPNSSSNTVTAGGTTSISGSPVTYSRGGNGGGDQSPSCNTHTAADNTGDGGGGAGNENGPISDNAGNAGGSGIVIIRYKFQ